MWRIGFQVIALYLFHPEIYAGWNHPGTYYWLGTKSKSCRSTLQIEVCRINTLDGITLEAFFD